MKEPRGEPYRRKDLSAPCHYFEVGAHHPMATFANSRRSESTGIEYANIIVP
jgi:hypothetical protein